MTKFISKALRLGRSTMFTVGLAVTLALVLGGATAALAAVPGDPFRLGRINSINRMSQFVGSTTSAMLRIDNNGSGSALELLVEPNKPPLTVNATAGKATNFNSDKLDGKTADGFYYYGEKVNDSEALDGIDSIEFFTQRTNTYQAYRSFTGPGSGLVQGYGVACDPGDKASGGGGAIFGAGDILRGTGPDLDSLPNTEGWFANVQDNGSASEVEVSAVCIDFAPFRP
jgi:hypothetical protein